MEIKINEKQTILLKYLSEIENNITTPSWQRILNESRVDDLYQNLKKELHNNQNPTINLGFIVVTEYKDSEWNLIDGQHRYMAMKKLQDEDGIDVQILINLIKISDFEEQDELFRKINQSTPVLLPPRTTKYNKFKNIAQEMANIFPHAFSSSDNPKRPHLNVQKVSEHLGLNYKFPEHSENLLIEKIKLLNVQYQNKGNDFFLYPGDTRDKIAELRELCMKKKDKCLLGLFKNYEWIQQLNTSSQIVEPQIPTKISPFKNFRKSLSKKLRTLVWDTYIGKLTRQGNCYSCNYTIDLTNFDCGHIIAVKNGGEDTIDNLRPICRECNLSCSSKNLNEFKTSLK